MRRQSLAWVCAGWLVASAIGCNGGDLNKPNSSQQPSQLPSSTNQTGTSTGTTQTPTAKSKSRAISKSNSNSGRVFLSNVKFKQGHDDGMRDAKSAMLDINANKMFNWIHGQDYSRGYDIGWKDGWAMKRAKRGQSQPGLQGKKIQAARMTRANGPSRPPTAQ